MRGYDNWKLSNPYDEQDNFEELRRELDDMWYEYDMLQLQGATEWLSRPDEERMCELYDSILRLEDYLEGR